MISVVIPTLNESAYIGKLLEGFRGQKEIAEIILVDGLSDDNTIEKAREVADRLRLPLKTHSVSKRDVAVQRNHGADVATQKWLLFLDADVTVPPDFARKALSEMEQRRLKVAGSRFYAAEDRWFFKLIYGCFALFIYPFIRLFDPILHGCAILVDKASFQQVNGFLPDITFEDYDFSRRISKLTKTGLLRQTAVKTSARRFYDASFAHIYELVSHTVFSIFTGKKVKNSQLVHYHDKKGRHPDPRY